MPSKAKRNISPFTFDPGIIHFMFVQNILKQRKENSIYTKITRLLLCNVLLQGRRQFSLKWAQLALSGSDVLSEQVLLFCAGAA